MVTDILSKEPATVMEKESPQASHPPPGGIIHRIVAFMESIKFSHSLFALPFALVALLLAAGGMPSSWVLFWVVVACVAARTAAMSFNRLVDRDVDARNPRTAGRPTVTGLVPPGLLVTAIVASSLLFVFSAAMLNRLAFLLSVPVLVILLFYSLTKRVTHFSHLFLGLALALAPLGAWIAVTGAFAIVPMILSLAVLFWVAGFDVLYSCQDHDIDRRDPDLHSLPKKLGVRGAMDMAIRFHGVSLLFFLLFWLVSPLGFLSLLGVLGVGFLLDHQHRLVRPGDLSRIDAAFFTANGMISVGFFLVVLLDVLLLGSV